MKALPVGLDAHYQGGTTSIANGLKITRIDSEVYAFTSAQSDVSISGVPYVASQGLVVTNIDQSAGFAVDNLELSTLDDGSIFSKLDILAGRWNNAAFELIKYNATAPQDGVETILRGTLGNVRMQGAVVTAELRGLQQYLQQPVGSVTSKACRARLGDSMCGVSLGPYMVTGSVTSKASNQAFTDTSRAEPADYFSEGLITFTSGTCSGITGKVKTSSAGGFALSIPMVLSFSIGDTYSLVAGCRKRLTEDCIAKFNNAINFQGEPHLPGFDAVTR